MKRLATFFLGALVMLLSAQVVWAARYPNATCTDSVTIKQLWHGTVMGPGAPVCQPFGAVNTVAGSDTVMGLGGIVTGIDAIPSAYGFYMQNTGPLDSMGVNVFTGAKNLVADTGYNMHLSRGDSVVVEWGAVETYQGSKEVLAPNNNQSLPNFIIRKVSASNLLPPIRTYTAHDLNMTNDPTSVGPRSYLCGLVRVSGPLKVARKLGTYEFLAVDPTMPSDSVDVYGGSLTTYAAPDTGVVLDWVQGIAEHRTPGTRSIYELLLRDGGDMGSFTTPPFVNDAYCVAEDQIRVVFDRDVTVDTATNPINYTLASYGSVDAAVMDGTSAVILTVSSAALHGTNETITVTGVAAVYGGVAITTGQQRTFVMGVLTVAEVSAPDPDTLGASPCFDKSKYAGGGGQNTQGTLGVRLTFAGSCTGTFGTLNYLEDAAPARTGNHGGLTVFGAPISIVANHQYLVAGSVQEFYGETELSGVAYASDLSVTAIPAPIPLPVKVASRDTCETDPENADLRGELFESMLVRLEYVKRVVRRDYAMKPVNGFHVAGPNLVFSDTMFVQNLNGALGASDSLNPNYPLENNLVHVTGALHYDSGSFRVCPRSGADIVPAGDISVAAPPSRTLSFSVYPNPARHTVVRFSLPASARVELGVYDVAGRRVASLADGNLPAGSYTRGWLGRDANGKPVGAGVYFYRLKAGNEVRTVRAIMLGD